MTLAVMARAPVPGLCKTRLAARIGDRAAADIYESMLRDTLGAYAALFDGVDGDATAGAPISCVDLVLMAAPEHAGVEVLSGLAPKGWRVVEQQGANLEARVLHAVHTLSGTSANHFVMLVGSDSPTVNLKPLLLYVEQKIACGGFRNSALMGPCVDGGYYLIGVCGKDQRLLTHMPWSTDALAAETRRRCAMFNIDLEELPEGADVDVLQDLKCLLRELREFPERAPRTAALLKALPLPR